MPLKATVTADEFETLPDVLKEHYKIQPDMSYQVDLGEGAYITDKDPEGLKSALEAEREETRKAKEAANRLEQEKIQAERSKITDVDELKKHFEDEMKKIRKQQEAEKKAAEEARVQQQTAAAEQAKKQKALEIASKLFGSNMPIMLPHVENSLKAVAGDSPKVEIIDPSTGMPSVDQNFENFEKNLSTNELYKPMVVVSKASGGSANDGKGLGFPSGTRDDGKPKTYADYKPSELMALKTESPELFQKLKSQKG